MSSQSDPRKRVKYSSVEVRYPGETTSRLVDMTRSAAGGARIRPASSRGPASANSSQEPALAQRQLSLARTRSTTASGPYRAARGPRLNIQPPLRSFQSGGAVLPYAEPVLAEDEANYAEGLAAYASQFGKEATRPTQPVGTVAAYGDVGEVGGSSASISTLPDVRGTDSAQPRRSEPQPPRAETTKRPKKIGQGFNTEKMYPMEDIHSTPSRTPSVHSLLNYDIPMQTSKPQETLGDGGGWGSAVLSDGGGYFDSVYEEALVPESQTMTPAGSALLSRSDSAAVPERGFSFGDIFGSMYDNAVANGTSPMIAEETPVRARSAPVAASPSTQVEDGSWSAEDYGLSMWLDDMATQPTHDRPEEPEPVRQVARFAPPSHATRALRLAILQLPNDYYSVSGGRTHLSIPSVSNTTHQFDEVCEASSLYAVRTSVTPTSRSHAKDLFHCSLLTDAEEHVVAGHRSAVLLTVAEHAGTCAHAVVGESLLGLMGLLERKQRGESLHPNAQHKDFFWQVDLSIGAIHERGTMDDFLAGRTVGMRAVSNPLVGNWVQDMTFQTVTSEHEVADKLMCVRAWLDRTSGDTNSSECLAIFAVARQVENLSSPSRENAVVLSSMLFLITRGPRDIYRLVMQPELLSPAMRSIVRPISTGAFVIAATCLTNHDRYESTEYINYCRNMSALHLPTPSSGCVNRYIASLEGRSRRRPDSDDLASSADVRELESAIEEIRSGYVRFRDAPDKLPVPFTLDRKAASEEGRSAPARMTPVPRPRSTSPVSAVSPTSTRNTAPPKAEELPMAAMPVRPSPATQRATSPSGPAKTTPSPAVLAQRAVSPAAFTPPPTSRRVTPPPPLPGYAPLSTSPVLSPPQSELRGAGKALGDSAALAQASAFADRRMHCVAVVSKNSGFSVESSTCVRNVRSGQRILVDEGVPRDAVDTDSANFSRESRELCSLFAEGYSGGVVSIDGRSQNLFASPAFSLLRNAVRTALEKETSTQDLRMGACLLRGTAEMMDLLVDPVTQAVPQTFRPLQVAVSPVFGPIPHDCTLYRLYSERDVSEAVRRVGLSVNGSWSSNTAMCLTLVNCYSTKADVVTSSLMIVVFGSHVEYYKTLQESKHTKSPARSLLRQIFHGPAAALLLVSLSTTADSERVANEVDKVPKEKDALRLGSVGEFVRVAQENLEREKAKVTSNPSSSAAASRMRALQRIETLVRDHEDLLYEPLSHFPPSYLPQRTTSSSDTGERSPRTTQASASPQPASHQRELSPQPNGSPASPSAPAASAVGLVVFVEENSRTAASTTLRNGRVTHRPTQEVMEADAIVSFRDQSFTEQKVSTVPIIEDLVHHVAGGRSCALIGIVDDTASVPCTEQPVWTVFSTLLNRCSFLDSWAEGSCVQLRMVTLFDRTIEADYLLDAATNDAPRKKASIGASPLFGTVVRNSAVVETTSTSGCERAVRTALRKLANTHVQDGTVTIASAVLKHVLQSDAPGGQGDVVLSSVTAVVVRAERDLPVLRDILSLDPQAATPCSLFRYALTGPCRVMGLTSLGNCSENRCAAALRLSRRVQMLDTKPAPCGSARQCVEQYKVKLSQSFDNMPEAQRRYVANIIVDLEELLKYPTTAPIVIYGVDGADSRRSTPTGRTSEERESPDRPRGTPGQPVQCIAVYTHSRGRNGPVDTADSGKVDVRTDTRSIMAPSGVSCQFDEVLVRVDSSAVVRPAMADTIAQRVVSGYNCALLVADATGSAVASKTLTRVVGTVMQRLQATEGVTLYMSVVAMQRSAPGTGPPMGEIKDMLRGSMYQPLRMAASPLFGSCVNGAKFALLTRSGDVFVTLKDALSVCAVEEAVLLVTLVMKREVPNAKAPNKEGVDVVMASLNIVVTPPEVSDGSRLPAQLFRDAVVDANEREHGALSGALNAPCYTFAVLGLSAGTPASELDDMLRLGGLLRGVRCGTPKQGSAMALAAQAERIVNGKPLPTDKADGELWEWKHVLADSAAMLSTPHRCVPKAYLIG